MRLWPVLALLTILCVAAASAAVFEPREFANAAAEARYKQLIDELRCLVCQNQNIADSDADLAKDLRDRVHHMVNDGKSNREIADYMVARYGDFVLYRPPLGAATVALWVGPFVLGAAALLMLLRRLRQTASTHAPTEALNDRERERARALLAGDDEPLER